LKKRDFDEITIIDHNHCEESQHEYISKTDEYNNRS
jgi:hypothetical protein